MTDFLITSTVCQIALFAVYSLLLENAKMHVFNRAFLLFALVFSLVIPFVTIEIETAEIVQNAPQIIQLLPISTEFKPAVETVDYWPIFWTLAYSIGFGIFAFRFVSNLMEIWRKIASNQIVERAKVKFVLLESETLPYTFHNYIFVNSEDFRRGIESQLYTHEITHVAQKHSLDILFVEILKTVFWFNPMVVFYKKAIQLNHEFLADEAVVANHDSIPYQELLLSKAHFPGGFALASSFNFSITKKRMIMMTKTTSRFGKIAKTMCAACAFAGLTTFFSVETVAQNVPPPPPPRVVDAVMPYYANTMFYIYKPDGTTKKKKYSDLTEAEKVMLPPPPPKSKKIKVRQAQLDRYLDGAEYAVWVDGKNVRNTGLSKYKASDFVCCTESKVYKNAQSRKFPQPNQVHLYTKSGYEKMEQSIVHPKVLEWHIDNGGNSVLKQKDAAPGLKEWKEVSSPKVTNDESATFPGGIKKFYEYVSKEFKVPASHIGTVRVVMTFFVEADGKISGARVVKTESDVLGAEAKRVLTNSPKWNPAKKDGKFVRSDYTLPLEVRK